MTRRWTSLVVLAAIVQTFGLSTSMPIAAADATSLDGGARIPGVTRVHSLLASDTRVFLTSPDTGLIVLRHDGTVDMTFDTMPGSAGMVLLGQTLYVAVPDGSRIDVVDISGGTPGLMGSMSTSPFTMPNDLAFAGGKLWFTTDGCGDSSGKIVSMNLDGSGLTELVPSEFVDWTECPTLTASEFAPDRLFVQASGVTPRTLHLYDVSGAPTLLTSSDFGWGNFSGSALAVLPGGTEFVMGNLGDSTVRGLGQFAVADFAGPSTSYVAEDFAGFAVDVTAENGGFVAGGIARPYIDQVWVWRIGQAQPVASFDLGYADILASPLSFTPDGTRLFGAVDRNSGGIQLVSIDPTGVAGTVQLRASKGTVKLGGSVRLTATVEGGSGTRAVRIYRIDGDRPKVIAHGTANSEGTFSADVSPSTNADYVAEFDGSSPPALSNEVTVKVRARVTGRMIRADGTSGRYRLYDYSDRCPSDPLTCPLFEVSVDPPHPRETITFELQAYSGGRWSTALMGEAPLGRDSSVIMYFSANSRTVIGLSLRVRARLPAHQDHAEGVSAWSYFRLR
jgi:hypothetical protein